MEDATQPTVAEVKYLPQKKRKQRTVKVNLSGKTAKYVIARARGLNKKQAAIEAGYTDGNNQTKIEKTATYKAIMTQYKDTLINKITMEEIAEEHKKNILQDSDKGAKNVAIKMALDKLEPEDTPGNDDDRVMVILRG